MKKVLVFAVCATLCACATAANKAAVTNAYPQQQPLPAQLSEFDICNERAKITIVVIGSWNVAEMTARYKADDTPPLDKMDIACSSLRAASDDHCYWQFGTGACVLQMVIWGGHVKRWYAEANTAKAPTTSESE